MHSIEKVFGEGCDLYKLLNCPRDADQAQLRKSYYRTALKYHPDRNKSSDEQSQQRANEQFQAISMAYQFLQDSEIRKDYDETGILPDENAVDDTQDDELHNAGVDQWKKYFDLIFGKVTLSDIDNFATKYKCSDEEKRDVLQHFSAQKGNLCKMLDFVMLSTPRDVPRWVTDYIQPAMEKDCKLAKYQKTMDKTLQECQRKVEKENKEMAGTKEDNDDSATETDTDHSDGVPSPPPKSQKPSKSSHPASKKPPQKAGATKAKAKSKAQKKKQEQSMDELVAQIRNRRGGGDGGGNPFAALGARYGVSMDEDDPLNDADFEKMQAKVEARRNVEKMKGRK